jgi:hypothetical protein
MNSDIYNFIELLPDDFNILVDEYFNLPEEEKNKISNLLVDFYSLTIDENPYLVKHYQNIIIKELSISVEVEDFERADILKRVYHILNKKYFIYKIL